MSATPAYYVTPTGNPAEPNQGFMPLGSYEQHIHLVETADDAAGAGTLRFGYTTWGMDANQLGYTYAPNDGATGGDVWLKGEYLATARCDSQPYTCRRKPPNS